MFSFRWENLRYAISPSCSLHDRPRTLGCERRAEHTVRNVAGHITHIQQTIHYGSKSHKILPSDNTPFDIYVTKPFESTKVAERVPNTGSLFSKPRLLSKTSGRSTAKLNKGALDSDIEALQNGLAAHEASRDRWVTPRVLLVVDSC